MDMQPVRLQAGSSDLRYERSRPERWRLYGLLKLRQPARAAEKQMGADHRMKGLIKLLKRGESE